MEKRLRNLSILISEYQAHAVDLVKFTCINPAKDISDEILKKTFVLVFRHIKGGKNFLPFHLFVYSKIIDAVKNAKETPSQYALTVKDLKADILIEHFNPAELKEADLFSVLDKISPEDRALLCLSIRHKINNEELASLFRTSKGTVISRSVRAKTALAKALIETCDLVQKKPPKTGDKTCFFTKNNVDDRNRIEKHITKCEPCRNFYGWQIKIEKLFEQEPKPVISSSINRDIFKQLNVISVDRRILYSVRTKLMARISFIIILLVSLFLLGWWTKDHVIMRKNNVQQLKITSTTVKKADDIKYLLTTTALKNWKDTDKKVKALAQTYGTVIEGGNEKGSTYSIVLDKSEALKLVQEIQTYDNFEVKTVTEPEVLDDKNKVRVDIQVNKNGF